LKHIDAEIYALVNSDIEFGKLVVTMRPLQRNHKQTIIQPKILDFKNKTCFEYAGAAVVSSINMGILTAEGAFFNHQKDGTIRRRNRNILG
jgi:hypothetical protein